MIKWNVMPKEPQDEIEEDIYLIYLHKSGRAISAQHNAMEKHFITTSEDEEHVYPYRYISHYAEMDWPEIDDGPMISWCEHGNMLICDICADRYSAITRQILSMRKEKEDEKYGKSLPNV